jgi:hypothetical protein
VGTQKHSEILKMLRFKEGRIDEIINTQRGIKFFKDAHRPSFDLLPEIDIDFIENWKKTNCIFDILLQSIEEKYVPIFDVLDKLLVKNVITKKDFSRFNKNMPHSYVTRRYFFEKLDNSK